MKVLDGTNEEQTRFSLQNESTLLRKAFQSSQALCTATYKKQWDIEIERPAIHTPAYSARFM